MLRVVGVSRDMETEAVQRCPIRLQVGFEILGGGLRAVIAVLPSRRHHHSLIGTKTANQALGMPVTLEPQMLPAEATTTPVEPPRLTGSSRHPASCVEIVAVRVNCRCANQTTLRARGRPTARRAVTR